MPRPGNYRAIYLCLLTGFLAVSASGAGSFRVVTYNIENYLDVATESRPAKSAEAKAKVRESIRALKPDVLALQEIGGTNALLELQASLKAEGLDLPHWEHVAGFDTNIHLAILSRLPFTARRPQTNDFFLLNGRRFRVSRGFAEVDIRVNDRYSFTLINAHLKSRLLIPSADEAELRLEEAKVLREKIDARLAANPDLNLIVLGDLNDSPDSQPIRTILGRGAKGLVDTRPAERNGDSGGLVPAGRQASRTVTWTQHYLKEDTYGRMDYFLVSRGMARELDAKETYILARPDWGHASDHRALVATFVDEDK